MWACGQELRKLVNSAARDHTGYASLLYDQLPRKADSPACLLLVFLCLCAFALLALMSAPILAVVYVNVVYLVFLCECPISRPRGRDLGLNIHEHGPGLPRRAYATGLQKRQI